MATSDYRPCARRTAILIPLMAGCLAMLNAGCDRSSTATSGDAPATERPKERADSQAKGATSAADRLFAEVTRDLGIDFIHDPGGGKNTYFMPRSVGSGAGVLDFDNDGRLDLYLLQNGGDKGKATCRLYRQTESGKFVDVSAGSGLDVHAWGMGVAVGDANNDGKVDVVVTEYGRSRLFLNRSEGAKPIFEDVSEAAGIDNGFWGTSASFVDYDRDGWLDLVIVNYIDYDPSRWCADPKGRQDFCGPDNFAGRVTKLFHNLGASSNGETSSAKFEDATTSSGLSSHPGPGLGVFCADFNGDRWPDIFVANDGKPNHLWINQQNGTFKEEGLQSGLATNAMGKAEANMGVAVGDVDGNGLFDLFVTHLTVETHTLWAQGPRGLFTDQTVAAGVTTAWRATGFGTVMADFNNDAHIDLALVNGQVLRGAIPKKIVPDADPFWAIYSERNQVLLNDGKARFRDVSEANGPFSGPAAVSRGLVCADLDNDGGLDLVVTRIAAPVGIYRNVAAKPGHWLQVRAVDPALHRDAYGAEIHLVADKLKRMQWINPGYSFACSNDPRAHFGLGPHDKYDSLTVIWPDGSEERFSGGSADRMVIVQRGEGTAVDSANE